MWGKEGLAGARNLEQGDPGEGQRVRGQVERKNWSFKFLGVRGLVWRYKRGHVGSSSGRDFSAEEWREG